MKELLTCAHPEWHGLLLDALRQMDDEYIAWLQSNKEWLPGKNALFAAFSLSLSSTNYILMGESPYPRMDSANGYAFWDNAVSSLWSDTGLSKQVNRATSLRNIMKMLLHANGALDMDFSQEAIAAVDKSKYIVTCNELFEGFLRHGFLLLNATLVYSVGKVNYHAQKWQPFMHHLLKQLVLYKPAIQLILFGRIAKQVPETSLFTHLIAEHPYNLSFITNSDVLDFFKPMDLLKHYEK